jgi:hypothetical protein
MTAPSWFASMSVALVVACSAAGCMAAVGSANGGDDVGDEDRDVGDDDDDDGGDDDDGDDLTCPAEPCSLYEQCGCDAGEACDLDTTAFSEGRGACRQADASGTADAYCTATTDCAVGYSCLGGQCRNLCDDEDDCDGNRCNIRVRYTAGGTTAYVPGVQACAKVCDIADETPDGCPDGMACRFMKDAAGYYSDCDRATAGGVSGTTCTAGGIECAPGHGCFTISAGVLECREMCAVTINGSPAADSCSTGTCTALSAGMQIGTTNYGYCQ